MSKSRKAIPRPEWESRAKVAKASLADHYAAESRSFRLQSSGIRVDGVPFDLRLYPYLVEIIDEASPIMTILKGAQMGFTITCILRSIEDMLEHSLRGTLYLFPTDDEVQDFAKARFGPMMQQPFYSHLKSRVDTAGLKQIGNGFMYFRGAGQRGGSPSKSLSKLKSMPSDRLYLDEYDEMEPIRVDAVIHRLDGSRDPQRVGLSTPTIPDYGVSLDYERSDQRMWFWTCEHCGQGTCLEQTWPDCIAEPAQGDPYYLCAHCRKRLERVRGTWIPKHPDRTEQHRGYYISQLGSTVKSASRILDDLEEAERTGRKREFYNQVLARPFADIEDRLTDELANLCLDKDRTRSRRDAGPCALGADVGTKDLHYVVGCRTTATDSRILDWGKIASFDELGQLARRYNVQVGVIDIGAETRAVRDFLNTHASWWGCQYVERQRSEYVWDRKSRVVSAGRTEALDTAHRAILNCRVRFPAPDERWHELVLPQLKNLARTRSEDKDTGTVGHRWVVTGGAKNDHMAHAHAYFHIALSRCPLHSDVSRVLGRGRRGRGGRPRSAMCA